MSYMTLVEITNLVINKKVFVQFIISVKISLSAGLHVNIFCEGFMSSHWLTLVHNLTTPGIHCSLFHQENTLLVNWGLLFHTTHAHWYLPSTYIQWLVASMDNILCPDTISMPGVYKNNVFKQNCSFIGFFLVNRWTISIRVHSLLLSQHQVHVVNTPYASPTFLSVSKFSKWS